MGLNTSQLVSSAGVVAGARRDHEKKLIDIQDKQLDIEARNRRADDTLRQRRIDRAGKELGGIDTRDTVEPGIAPKAKAGLDTSAPASTTGTATGKSAGTTTTSKAGLKTEGEGKESSSFGGVELPKDMLVFKDMTFEKDDLAQGENETNIKFGVRNFLSNLSEKVQTAIGTADAKGGLGPGLQDSGSGTSPFRQKVSEINTFSGTPADMKKAGFKTKEEVNKFNSDRDRLKEEIHQWFGKRPGAILQFQKLPIAEQVQTFKAIMGEIDGNTDKDSGLTKEAEATASTAADDVKAAKKKAGLPATSAIQDKKPSKRRTAKLEGDRGAPRGEALELKTAYEELATQMQEEIWVGDDNSAKNIGAIRKEMAVLKEAYKHALGVQGTQDFQVAGDTRMMQGLMEKKLGSKVDIQELDNGNYNILATDAETGELVPVHEDQSRDSLLASHRAANDKAYAKAYQDIVAKQSELEMELTFEKSLEYFKNKMGMQRDQAKAFLEAQVASAKGEDVAWINAKIDGDDQFVVRKGSRYFMVTPPTKTKAGETSPGMTEIDPPF